MHVKECVAVAIYIISNPSMCLSSLPLSAQDLWSPLVETYDFPNIRFEWRRWRLQTQLVLRLSRQVEYVSYGYFE